ncbi:hypothetical protein LguiA_006784 [Lonicera macranthoides]
MDSYEFDNVKAEKANAIARYRRFRNIAKLLQIIEVFVALTLLSWSWTRLPAAIKMASEYLFQFSVCLLNPHVVFLIGNVIVITLFVLSRHYEAEVYSGTTDPYEEYVPNNEDFAAAPATNVESPPEPTQTAKESTSEDKQIVCAENAACKMQCEAVATAIEKATKQIQKFQRTQSEKLKCEIRVKPRLELRRSETERRQRVVKSDELDKVESLSNEEFRLTIEAFIAKQQRFLWAQKMAENDN